MANEPDLWEAQRPTAEIALSFIIDFLGCQMGANNDQDLDANATSRLMKIIRAVSWVESKHGTAGPSGNHPKEDPLQSGNPNDSWWKELTGQSGNGSRFVRGKGLSNLWAKEVQAAAEATPGFPSAASFSLLSDKTDGHDDAGFAPAHSYTWGVLYLVHKINTTAGDRSYQCRDLGRQRLIDGAVAYNGGGVPDYEQRIIDALALIGDIPPPARPRRGKKVQAARRKTKKTRKIARKIRKIARIPRQAPRKRAAKKVKKATKIKSYRRR
jgi:hypothetical protein